MGRLLDKVPLIQCPIMTAMGSKAHGEMFDFLVPEGIRQAKRFPKGRADRSAFSICRRVYIQHKPLSMFPQSLLGHLQSLLGHLPSLLGHLQSSNRLQGLHLQELLFKQCTTSQMLLYAWHCAAGPTVAHQQQHPCRFVLCLNSMIQTFH